ncbi:AraC family transcriptional regulator [Streptomyces sp. AV19]|uniref:AraC family transcriptional regulator n=1 Tax=Streptomyces sp. AV19 TaxID=2793068 RepID=UPI0018FE1240|nr:helix-turn-helix domain-containing protein [Streptomyces sp. AV19]MBH1938375.1 AraC family transcriptional regulator [Streptomyces sp. AV19]MDG4535024.1 helix-turn-helix domain-containing protein [Streptomyces sp. AV19]
MVDQTAVLSTPVPGSAELAYRAPHPRLAGLVLTYTGEDRSPAQPLLRRVMALATVVLVIDFEPPIRQVVTDIRPPARQHPTASLVSGLSDRPMLIEQTGRAYGMTVQLTPPGARALFGLPLNEITNTTLGLDDLLGVSARRLTCRLAEAPDWPSRFRLLDSYLIARIGAGPELAAPVRRAWQRLTALSGDVRIGTLADEVGWSRQHLNARFHQEIGLPPKTVGRIARLQKTLSFMGDAGRFSWADAAAACGFTDQPHLNRDFRMLAGCTPTDLRTLMTDWSGLLTGNPLMTHRPLLRRITDGMSGPL